jgi:hypothetical protein
MGGGDKTGCVQTPAANLAPPVGAKGLSSPTRSAPPTFGRALAASAASTDTHTGSAGVRLCGLSHEDIMAAFKEYGTRQSVLTHQGTCMWCVLVHVCLRI